MKVVQRVGSLITRGAVDIIAVRQNDGSYRSTPWYVRFGMFQGVLKGDENMVGVSVNGVDADFQMYLNESGEAYFLREYDDQDSNDFSSFRTCEGDGLEILDDVDGTRQQEGSTANSPSTSNSDVVLMSKDGYVVTVPVSKEEDDTDHVHLGTAQFHLGPDEASGTDFVGAGSIWIDGLVCNLDSSEDMDVIISEGHSEATGDAIEIPISGSESNTVEETLLSLRKDDDMFKSCLDLTEKVKGDNSQDVNLTVSDLDMNNKTDNSIDVEHFGEENDTEESPVIPVSASSHRLRFWPIPLRRLKYLQHSRSDCSNDEVFLDSEPCFPSTIEEQNKSISNSHTPRKRFLRTNIPTSEQIASLNLKEGQNMVAFTFSSRVLGKQQIHAHIYLWKWNARIVISDIDGTITRSDVLGQVMPLVGKDWAQNGVASLFSAIKENGYQLLFLSARAIVQAYLTKSFLFNLKQDGSALPAGPVVVSPDGLFPSLYREVIRRAPHEFKIACLQDIRALFPADYNPFYAGFGNRDTDELSYRKIGIPKGKIFIINPKGEIALYNRTDMKSYSSLHTMVDDMFPPTYLAEQEDYNSWNYWKLPLATID